MSQYGKRHALGQHFLRDTKIINDICDAALEQVRTHSAPTVLEIGPGRGALTFPLLERLTQGSPTNQLILAERDQQLAAEWAQHFRNNPPSNFKIRLEPDDFLCLAEDRWLNTAPGPLIVVSNLPYSAGTAIVLRLAQFPKKIPAMVLMFQAEVAQRLYAEPSTKSWGSLSIWMQNIWDIQRLLTVPPKSFAPPPKVDSEVVLLTPREEPRILIKNEEEEKKWDQLLRVCFSHRRKMLRSGLPSGQWQNALELSGVDGTKRAEALSWDEWNQLFRALLN